MRTARLHTVALAIGGLFVLTAVFGSNLAGIHIPALIRICLLLVGLAILAYALERRAGSQIRRHFEMRRNTYAGLFTYLSFSIAGAIVLLAYLYFSSIGTWTDLPPSTDYYDRLASAFRAGHLYVSERPGPALLALANPYDPDARAGFDAASTKDLDSIWDLSLYKGKVYLYWGPAPALLLDVLKAVYPGAVGDNILTFGFLSGSFLFQSLLLIRVWRRFMRAVPAWMVVAGILLVGFIHPTSWLLFEPRIYEAAIAAGQFFLMAGIYLAYSAFDRQVASRLRLALAAIAWVCAVGSRATLAVAVPFLALMVLVWLFRKVHGSWDFGGSLVPAVAFGIPLLAGALLLAWYNLARFGSIFEFGFRYAITMLDQNRYHAVLFSPIYIRPNAFMYFLNAPALDAAFPFVKPIWNGDYVAAFNASVHGIYNVERIVGLIYVAPFLLFSLLAPGLIIASSGSRKPEPPTPETHSIGAEREPLMRWLVFTLAASALLELVIVLSVYYATARYFLDAGATLAILSVLGSWLGCSRLKARRVWLAGYGFGAVALLLFTIIISVLIGFSSDVPRMKAANPAFLSHLRLFFIALARHF